MRLHDIRAYYETAPLDIPNLWNLSRKHFRIVSPNRKFLKLNKCRNRINVRELRYFCIRYAPLHVYFCVLDWLFPERVGKKHRANRAVPLQGSYVFDIDNTNVWIPHNHVEGRICKECLINSKHLAIHVCEGIELLIPHRRDLFQDFYNQIDENNNY